LTDFNAIARQPVAAEAKRARMPNFASDDEVVMENPYLQSRVATWGRKPVRGGATLAQSRGLGNAKSLSK
jgi:hypothetical protein